MEEKPPAPTRPLTPQQQMVGVLLELMPHLSGAKRWVRLASELVKAGIAAEQMREWYGEGGRWYRDDWRGQKGHPPSETGIRETALRYLAAPDQANKGADAMAQFFEIIQAKAAEHGD